MHKNPELDLAYQFVQYTNSNIFLTGKAGTGKTTFLRSLKSRSNKRMVVVAPTGVAAINAGGQTIHSFFQLPFGPILTKKVAPHQHNAENFKQKFQKRKIKIIKSLDLLVIDEISMVRADILDAIDEVLRRYKNRYLPFGGVQLLMIGDIQQLAPVVKEQEWNLLRPYYKSMYFFNSIALSETGMETIELKHVYRQEDASFLNILNEIRNDSLSQQSYEKLHQRYIPDFSPKEKEGYITLTTHNHLANTINEEHLKKIEGKTHRFSARVKGNFPEYTYPTDFELEFKVGSQVMFVKNDSSAEKRYFNGKIGKITAFEDGHIVVRCEGDDEEIYAGQEVWENIKYSINEKTKEIEEEVIGSFTQFPLRLAWAITIHKSQGLTFEKAIIDAASAFAHGQTYVALSRCKSLEGMVLSSKISESSIICDSEVSSFNKSVEENQPDEKRLEHAKNSYQLELILDLFNYKQLFFRLQQLERRIEEHKKSIQGNLPEAVREIQKTAIPNINAIAQKFENQVQLLLAENPDAENNQKLQERIKKAAEYFHKYHQDKIIKLLKESSFESDSKASKKAIEESLSLINEILNIKQKSLNTCLNGFQVHTYLEVRAKSAIEEESKPKKTKVSYKDIDTKHPELYSLLKFWRKEVANEKDVAFYQVASQKMLQGIANELPCTTTQLLNIHGLGKKKAAEFGEEIIEMVMEYIEEKGLEVTSDAPEVIKTPKEKNHEKSYKLYLSGMSVEDIAVKLGFVVSTIENHLCAYVATGDLDADEFVEQTIIDTVSEYFKKNPESSLGDAKRDLDDNISYTQIRFVQKHLEFLHAKPLLEKSSDN